MIYPFWVYLIAFLIPIGLAIGITGLVYLAYYLWGDWLDGWNSNDREENE